MSFIRNLNEALGTPPTPDPKDYKLTKYQDAILVTRKDDPNRPSNTSNYAEIHLSDCKHGVKFADVMVAGHHPYKFEIENLLAPPKAAKPIQSDPDKLEDEDEFEQEYEDPEFDPRTESGVAQSEDWIALFNILYALMPELKQRQMVVGSYRSGPSQINSGIRHVVYQDIYDNYIDCDGDKSQHETGRGPDLFH
jgi:hypothetical protein